MSVNAYFRDGNHGNDVLNRLFDDLVFVTVWQTLAASGDVDEAGGAQFRRCYEGWQALGRPLSPENVCACIESFKEGGKG